MTSPQRRWTKIHIMESMIMAYHTMLETGTVPITNEIINFHRSRWGKPVMESDRVRAHEGMFGLRQDILKQLAGMELTEKDYIKNLKERGLNDVLEVYSSIKDPKAKAPKPAKKQKKEAEDNAEA